MALHKIRKHSIKGCLLVQFKYIENEGDFTTSSSSFVAVAGKNITMTPQYADSIIETSASFSIVDTANTQNTSMTFETALYVNNSEEHVQGQLGGFTLMVMTILIRVVVMIELHQQEDMDMSLT